MTRRSAARHCGVAAHHARVAGAEEVDVVIDDMVAKSLTQHGALIQAGDGAWASEEDAAPALIGAVERGWAGDRFLPAVGDAFGARALELAQRCATGLAARASRAEGHDAHARWSAD